MRNTRFMAIVGCGAIGAGALMAARAAIGQDAAPRGAGGPVVIAPPGAAAVYLPQPSPPPPRPVTTYQNTPFGWRETQFVVPGDSPLQQTSVELDRQIGALTSRYGEIAEDAERQKAKAELAELLGKQFEVQQQIREEEVGQLESRVEKLRALIDKRKDARQSIIEKRLDQLLREAEGLGWNAGGEGAHRAVYRAPLALPTRVEATKTSASPSAK